MTETVPDRIEREIVIAAPIERVWAALTDPQQIPLWFSDAGAEVDLRPGGTMVLRWKEYGTYYTTIQQVEPPYRFSYLGAYTQEEAPRDDNATLVEFTLEPEGEGTRLRVVESGFRNLAMPEAERAKRAAENTAGWIQVLDVLRNAVQPDAA
jgi:uncharacterized protein YndB with AHSA1/START domain